MDCLAFFLPHLFLAAATPAPPDYLRGLVAILSAGVLLAYLGSRFGLVPIIGFLLAGVAVGPHALGLISDPHRVDSIAEIGVILLLFTIGMEFSIEKLARLKRMIFLGGTLQVSLAVLATMGLLLAFQIPWRAALFTGFLVSLSSTAIILKLFADRGETGSTQGQVSLALLIFQDVAVIAMVLVMPVLSGGHTSMLDLPLALGRALILILLVLVVARKVMPSILDIVAKTCSPEIFLLTVIVVCFGTAYLSFLLGVSLSLGAFLAGLVVSESRFSEHAINEILPLQILFSAMFFVSVGMLMDVRFLFTHPLLVLCAIALILVIKAVTTGVSIAALGYRAPVAAMSGLALAQIGEFSFVLERAGREAGLTPANLGADGSQAFIASTVLLMLGTPQLTTLGGWIGKKLEKGQVHREIRLAESVTGDGVALDDHVILAGYGDAARALAGQLAKESLPFVVATLSPAGALEAERAGYVTLRGDYAKHRQLLLLGIDKARMLVVADDEPSVAQRVVAVARMMNPNIRIVARVHFSAAVETLEEVGASLVVSEEAEAVATIQRDVLREYHRDTAEQERAASAVRREVTQRATMRLVTRQESACAPKGRAFEVTPESWGCQECIKQGTEWVHLRICMVCGHVGCCDSSPHKHARAHWHESQHAVMRSMEPGEEWGWCYEDDREL